MFNQLLSADNVFRHDIMCGGGTLSLFKPLQCRDRLYASESDVYRRRRQILTSKVDPRIVRINIFIMTVDP